MKKYIWSVAEFLVGILPGFFLVFNFMFSDVISIRERIFSFLLVTVTYLLLGMAFGLAGHSVGLGGVWLSLPALILALLYSFSEAGLVIMNSAYAFGALAFSIAGYRIGASFSINRKRR